MNVMPLRRRLAALTLATGLLVGFGAGALAENAMGYQLLSEQEAARLPRNQGALGLDVARAQQIADAGLTFDIMRVTGVKEGSAGARAGLRRGDQIIAVNGRVFPTLRAFAAYVGSLGPGATAAIDYMPSGAGPAQAQRLNVTVGGAGRTQAPPAPAQPQSGGLSTGTKVAIGAGAVALLGCYEFGCFSHKQKQPSGQPQAR